jgi:hypothetical protein
VRLKVDHYFALWSTKNLINDLLKIMQEFVDGVICK